MRYGLHLPSAQMGANAPDILSVAKAADRLGFDSVWMFDHLFTPVELESKYPYSGSGNYALGPDDPFYDPLALYGVVAGATEKVRIGTGVLIGAYRHPIVLGKILSSVENLAPGRVMLGLGAGWMREEFQGLGLAFERRGARLEEYVAALRAVWSGRASHHGDFYSWPEAGFGPSPTAPIPIILGGHGERTLQRVARLGDGWMAVTAPGQGTGLDGIAGRLEALRRACEDEGRDFGSLHNVYQHALWFSDHASEKLPLTGPAEEIAASIKRLADLGISEIDLIVFGAGEQIVETAERFRAEVLPLLRPPA